MAKTPPAKTPPAKATPAKAALFRAALGLILPLVLSGTASAAPTAIPLSIFRAQVTAAAGTVAACRARAAACDSRSLPTDAEVAGEANTPGFHAGWQWLRDATDQAAKAPAAERSAAMDAAAAHLAELSAQTSTDSTPSAIGSELPAARAAADRVLARAEFRPDAGPTWLDRQIARLQDALLRLFFGMGRVGARNPWIAPLIEWLCFGLAAAGLLLSLHRSLNRQALRISLVGMAPAAAASGQSGANWLADADAAEAAGRGREAIHCLYWAAIASLEARQAWRPNPTRTPREYLHLLRPGSAAQHALRDLTRRFERAWYGIAQPGAVEPGAAEIQATEVQAARRDLATLQAGALNRATAAAIVDQPSRTSAPASVSAGSAV